MLAPAVFFWQIALAVHIIFVVAAFGLLLAYPFIVMAVERFDVRSLPVLLRVRQLLGRNLVNPGLLIVVIAGVYLAAHAHQWHAFYVQWGIGAAIVMGALEGMFMIPREGRLADLARSDLEAQSGQSGTVVIRGAEYQAVFRQVAIGGMALSLIVILTVYFMATQAGA